MNRLLLSALCACGLIGPAFAASQATLKADTGLYQASGGTVTLHAATSYDGTPGSIGWTVTVPHGWTYVSGTNEPGIKPAANRVGALEWAYIDVPVNEASFTFVVSYPSGLAGAQTITAQVIVRSAQKITLTPPALVFNSTASQHTMSFEPLPALTVGASAVTLAATSSSGLPLRYTSSDATVATIVGDLLTVVGAGKATITVGDGVYTVTQTLIVNPVGSAASQLINISTRGIVAGNDKVLIGGLVIGGNAPKQVLVRAIGPSLAAFGVTRPVAAVHLEVFSGNQLIAAGDSWGTASNAKDIENVAARVGAFSIAADSRDAALILNLDPGAYTAVVSGLDAASGVALVEVYDADEVGSGSRLLNISTRGTAGPGEDALVGGFVVRGDTPKQILVRAVGPSLSEFGITAMLPHPVISIFHGQELVAGQNETDTATIARSVGAFPLLVDGGDAAQAVTLDPGAYTAVLSGSDGNSGIALVEIYAMGG